MSWLYLEWDFFSLEEWPFCASGKARGHAHLHSCVLVPSLVASCSPLPCPPGAWRPSAPMHCRAVAGRFGWRAVSPAPEPLQETPFPVSCVLLGCSDHSLGQCLSCVRDTGLQGAEARTPGGDPRSQAEATPVHHTSRIQEEPAGSAASAPWRRGSSSPQPGCCPGSRTPAPGSGSAAVQTLGSGRSAPASSPVCLLFPFVGHFPPTPLECLLVWGVAELHGQRSFSRLCQEHFEQGPWGRSSQATPSEGELLYANPH